MNFLFLHFHARISSMISEDYRKRSNHLCSTQSMVLTPAFANLAIGNPKHKAQGRGLQFHCVVDGLNQKICAQAIASGYEYGSRNQGLCPSRVNPHSLFS